MKMIRRAFFSSLVCAALSTATAQNLPGNSLSQYEKSQVDKPIDLMTPRIKIEGITFYIGKVLYRGGQIVSVDPEGKTVTINTTSGRLNLEWEKLNAETQAKFQAQYDVAVAKAVRAVEQQMEAAEGIIYVRGKVLSVADEGLLLVDSDGTVFLLSGHPSQSAYVDDDIVSCKAKLSGTFKYGAVSGARKTVRAYKFIRE